MDRQKTNVFLLSLDEDLLVYEEELKKRGFTSSATLKYIRENNLEEMNMAEGHKRLLMNAVSKLQSPQAQQITTKECDNMMSKSKKKRRISYATSNINKPSSPSSEQPFIDSDEEERQLSISNEQTRANTSTNGIETPVQRFLRHKRDTIGELQSNLEQKRARLSGMRNSIYLVQEQNTNKQSNSSCGNCHLRLGHTRRNCTFSPCRSVYSCGLLEKHPDEKKSMSALQNETSQLEKKIQKLQAEYDSYVKVKTSSDHSKTKQIEDKLVAENPSRYINANGAKNWMLLNKDVAILEKKLHVNKAGLPDRKSMMRMLQESTKEFSFFGNTTTSKKKENENPKRPTLEAHGINFPTSATNTDASVGTTSSTSSRISMQDQGEEYDISEMDDFSLAISLQNQELNQYEAASALVKMHGPKGTM